MSQFADLARWTPVALSLAPPRPAIDWGDLRGVRFSEPFFDQTVERWAGDEPAPLVRTDLDALLELDAAPSLDPSLLIFHLSRCGSTLLSRLLATLPETLVVAEPAPLNALLGADPDTVDRAVLVRVLRLLARALGRRRFGDERRYVLKLSSWNIRHISLFRQAFPGVPAVWVQRDPEAVMASLLASPAGWMRLQSRPRQAEALFAIADADAASGPEAFLAQALAAMFLAAAATGGPEHVVDYHELPDAAWTRIAPLLGVAATAEIVERMRAEASYYSKDRVRRPFTGDPPARQALQAGIRGLAESLEPLYRALDRRRLQA